VELDQASTLADAIVGDCRRAGSNKSALAAAMCGDDARAEGLAAESAARFPTGTLWNGVELPAVRAAAALAAHQPLKAIELLANATPYERAFPEVRYLRGLAFLMLGRGTDAAAAFRRILDEKGTAWDLDYASTGLARPLIHSLSDAGLARASEISGDTATAKQASEDFLALWRDADVLPPATLTRPKALTTVSRQ
jgi:eukaryotic-like serine/threonine-protein kinase